MYIVHVQQVERFVQLNVVHCYNLFCGQKIFLHILTVQCCIEDWFVQVFRLNGMLCSSNAISVFVVDFVMQLIKPAAYFVHSFLWN